MSFIPLARARYNILLLRLNNFLFFLFVILYNFSVQYTDWWYCVCITCLSFGCTIHPQVHRTFSSGCVCVCLCAIVLFCILYIFLCYNFCLFLLVSVWKMQSRRRSMKWKRNETQQITQLSWAKLKIAITKKSRGGGKQEHADIAHTHTAIRIWIFWLLSNVREKDRVCIDIGIFCIARVPPKGKGLTMAL